MSYIRDRMVQAVVTIFSVITITFFLYQFLPGGPVQALRQRILAEPKQYGLDYGPSERAVNQKIEAMLNIPPGDTIWEQYVEYLLGVVTQGDLGESMVVEPGAPVWELILIYAPWTVFLNTLAWIVGFPTGIILGAFMAYAEGSKFDVGMTILTTLLSSIPSFLFGLLLLFLFAYQLRWFPAGGRTDPGTPPGMQLEWALSVFYYALLPALSFLAPGLGGSLRLRANATRLLGSGYVRNARLRGLGAHRITMTYMLRNSILPVWTDILISMGGILGGSVIIELMFSYPGMGLLMFDAVVTRDWPVMMGTFIMMTTLFVIGTMVADFTYPLIDPRADVKRSNE